MHGNNDDDVDDEAAGWDCEPFAVIPYMQTICILYGMTGSIYMWWVESLD
jgi:hypothetical protein